MKSIHKIVQSHTNAQESKPLQVTGRPRPHLQETVMRLNLFFFVHGALVP